MYALYIERTDKDIRLMISGCLTLAQYNKTIGQEVRAMV